MLQVSSAYPGCPRCCENDPIMDLIVEWNLTGLKEEV